MEFVSECTESAEKEWTKKEIRNKMARRILRLISI